MSDENQAGASQNPASDNPRLFQQEVQHSQISARVPEHIGPGVFSTGAIVMQGAHEFVLDFLQNVSQPRRIVARVVLPVSVVPLLIEAMRDNLQKYERQFGALPRLPAPPPGTAPTPVAEIYEQLKLPEQLLSGAFANTVMIVHTPAEFCFDFITNFFPRSAVACRVHLAAPHVPEILQSLANAFEQFCRRQESQRRAAETNPPSPPPGKN